MITRENILPAVFIYWPLKTAWR